MKKILFFIFALLIIACAAKKQHKKLENSKVEISENTVDSTEYELIVFDVGFETWYMLNSNKANERSQQYYENRNYEYVTRWNYLYQTAGYSFINSYIDYSPHIDYGFELNKKLYYYFRYVERETGVRLR